MVMDQKGRLFGKVSIIDTLIVLVVLSATLVFYFVYGKDAIRGYTPKEIQLTLYCEELPDYAAKSIQKGDIVIDDIERDELGTVKDVLIGKSVSWAQTEKGEFVKSSKEGYASVTVTVEGKGDLSGKGIVIGNNTYFIGKSTVFRIANTAISARISSARILNGKN